MTRLHLRAAAALIVTIILGTLGARSAGAQTAEGTSIRNIATVTFTDANSNSYAPKADTTDVTVGFAAGINVTSVSTTATPTSPSTADTLTFKVLNIGNGTDSVSVGETISVAGVITVTSYLLGATPYASLALLNTALSGTAIAAGDSVTIKVVFNTEVGKGGVATVYTLAGTSRRTPSATASRAITVTPATTTGVTMSPKGGLNLTRLPSNGTNYTFAFTVTNNGNGSDDFDLLASHPGTPVTIVSVNGVAGDSTRISSLASGASQVVNVVYSIGNVAAGTVDTLRLKARSTLTPATLDTGYADLTVVKAALAITKSLYRDDQSTLVGGADTVVPGEYVQYRISVTNSGGASASTVQVTDAIASELTYQSSSGDLAGWTFSMNSGTLTADLTGTLAGGATRYFWIRVRLN